MKIKLKYAILNCVFSFILFILFISPVLGMEQLSVGARPLGMGRSFVAVADDGNAIYWNPAGMSRIRRYVVSSMYSNLYDISGLKNSYLSLIVPATKNLAVGIDWMHLGFDDDELGFSKDLVNFSYSLNYRDFLSVGMNAKYIAVDTILDKESIGAATGWGLDCGLLFNPPKIPLAPFNKGGTKRLQIGVMLQDVGVRADKEKKRGTSVKYDTGVRETIYPTVYKFGLAYYLMKNPKRNWLLALDLDDRFHLGAEFSPHPFLSVRAGLQKDFHIDEPMTFSAGATVKLKWGQFDYAYVIPPMLPASSRFSLSFSFEFHRSPIKIEGVKIKEMFPAFHKFYAEPNETAQVIRIPETEARKEPEAEKDSIYTFQPEDTIGRVWFRNNGKKKVDAKVLLLVGEYMYEDAPIEATEYVEGIQPRELVSVPLRKLVFNENVLTLPYDRDNVTAHVIISSILGEEIRKVESVQNFKLYSKNRIVWDEVEKLGAFITPEDKAVVTFSRTLLRHYEKEIKATTLPKNLYKAMLIFNALAAYGIRPSVDSNHPAQTWGIDEVKFPCEMLKERRPYRGIKEEESLGDCDDSTALYCSLLESCGIHTALIEQEDHLFMMFDLGEKLDIDDEKSRSFEYRMETLDETSWIPVETTMLQQGFAQAWRAASQRMTEYEQARKINYIAPVSSAWQKYQPANVTTEWELAPSDVLPKNAARKSQFERQIEALEKRLAEILQNL